MPVNEPGLTADLTALFGDLTGNTAAEGAAAFAEAIADNVTDPTGGAVADGDYGDIIVSGSGVAWTIDAEAKALRHVSASTAALIYSSEPLWGAAFAALFLGERLQGVGGWVGAALVVGSSLVSQVGGAAGKGGRKGGEEGSAREKR